VARGQGDQATVSHEFVFGGDARQIRIYLPELDHSENPLGGCDLSILPDVRRSCRRCKPLAGVRTSFASEGSIFAVLD